jgi:predicted enzyme related to lactoylglutathione lyase
MKLKLAALGILAMLATACTTASRPDLAGMSFSSDPLLGKVVWHDLITEDLDTARSFYGGLFGWTFEESTGSRGESYLLARKDRVLVAGLLAYAPPADDKQYSRWLPYISVDDVDAATARATAAGARVVADARNLGSGRVAAIVDPQGAVVGLARSSIGDPDDKTTAPAPGRPVWNELVADDPAVAATFYRTLAGYRVETIQRRGGEYFLLTNNGVRRAGIFQNPADEDYMPVWLTAFGVADPAAAAARAESLGGKIILPASPELRDGTIALVTDPSGAILVLQSWSAKGDEA